MQKLSEALSPDTSKTFQKKQKLPRHFKKTEPYFRRCTHMHQIFATRAACQIVGGWLPESSIDQRPSRPTKEKMTSQQIKTNSYHILSCSDNNYQINYSLTRSHAEPDLLRSHAETCQRLLNCCSRVLRAELQNCKARARRGHGSQPGAAAERILQSANMNQKPMRIFAEPFKHESETTENLCRTFQT